jgi:hypothetical protein
MGPPPEMIFVALRCWNQDDGSVVVVVDVVVLRGTSVVVVDGSVGGVVPSTGRSSRHAPTPRIAKTARSTTMFRPGWRVSSRAI